MLLVATAIAAGYLAFYLNRGWVAHDEGAFAQSAERVLQGELPHRTFDELYTGGLTFVNAWAFRVFGMRLTSMRIVLFMVFIPWIAAFYWIAARFLSPVASLGVTLLAAAWSVPNYAAAVPSWYNLFLATFGVCALLAWLDSGRLRWVFLAGICGGLSIVVKIAGLYFVAAALLFFVFQEQETSRCAQRAQRRVYSVLLTATSVVFVALLVALLQKHLKAQEFVYFVAPGGALAFLLVIREWNDGAREASSHRSMTIFRILAPFLAGIAIPVLLFVTPYLESHSLGALFHGVFMAPAKRLDSAFFSVPSLKTTGTWIVPLLALLGIAIYPRVRPSRWRDGSVILALLAVLVGSGKHVQLYRFGWYSTVMIVPVAAVAGALLLLRRKTVTLRRRGELFLLLAVAALCSLIEYPFSAPIYFCYVAPLAIMAVVALIGALPADRPSAPAILASLVAFYTLFAVLRVTPSFLYHMGERYEPDRQTTRLDLARAGGLRIASQEAGLYEQLVSVMRLHAGSSAYAYAAPDCPEVYFLSGMRNPTRTLFDFFDDSRNKTGRIMQTLQTDQVNVVVISNMPAFSGRLMPSLVEALTVAYPNAAQVGKFEVRWRE